MRDLIEASLNGSWRELRLPQPLEERYRREVVTPAGWYLQSWLLVLIAFNIASTWLDIDTFGFDAIAIPFGLTMGLYVPIAIVSILLCSGRPSQSRQAVVTIVNTVVDMAIVLNSARMAPPSKIDAYLILAALLPFAAGTIVTIPFRHGLVFYGLSFIIYVLAIATPPLGTHLQEGLPLLCAGLLLVPLKICFSREKDAKRAFLLAYLGRIQADDLRAANERLTVLSGTDPLTGLRNRRAFSDGLDGAWQKARDLGTWLGVVLIDVDLFKLFNDTQGHADGDRCLIEVAQALDAVVVAHHGILGRYGGEEFAAYLSECSPEAILEIGDALREAVRTLAIRHPALSDDRTVSVSIGVTAVHGAGLHPAITPATLLATADEALYAAKRAGRDRVSARAVRSPVPLPTPWTGRPVPGAFEIALMG